MKNDERRRVAERKHKEIMKETHRTQIALNEFYKKEEGVFYGSGIAD